MIDIIPFVWVLLITLVGLLVGFAAGRRQGLYLGKKHGVAESHVKLRHESLETGCCKICNRSFD